MIQSNNHKNNIDSDQNRNDKQKNIKPKNEPINKKNYVDIAESVMKNVIKNDKNKKLTTTQIRKFLSMSAELNDRAKKINNNQLNEDIQSDIQYLRMQIAYHAGREKVVKEFVNKSDLLNEIKRIGDSKDKLIVFCRYMEALVAYHRFLGGRDK